MLFSCTGSLLELSYGEVFWENVKFQSPTLYGVELTSFKLLLHIITQKRSTKAMELNQRKVFPINAFVAFQGRVFFITFFFPDQHVHV